MKIHALYILKDSGICLYSRNFTDEFDAINENLLAPFFSALFSFSKGIVSRELEELEMAGLRFAFKLKKEFIFVIVADSSVSLLFVSSCLKRIISNFFKVYDQLGGLKDMQMIENPKFDNINDAVITGEAERFQSKGFYQKIIKIFRSLIQENEIIGAAVLSNTGNILYSSLPSEILKASLKELEIRFMVGALKVPELYYRLENGQKIFSKTIPFKNTSFFLVLLFESSVQLGMAELNLNKISKKIENLL